MARHSFAEYLAVRQREGSRRPLGCRAIRFMFKFYFNPRSSPADKRVSAPRYTRRVSVHIALIAIALAQRLEIGLSIGLGPTALLAGDARKCRFDVERHAFGVAADVEQAPDSSQCQSSAAFSSMRCCT